MTILRKTTALKNAIRRLLPRNAILYRLGRSYVDYYRGENNDDLHTNGELHWMKEVLPHCATCFDVGANVGDWTTLALAINSSTRLHCFEPSVTTFRMLCANCFPDNVKCNNFGLGAEPGDRNLWVFADGSGSNSLYKRQGLETGWGLKEQQRSETVRIETLDEYCERGGIDVIDLLKVDVEGHELDVFKGARKMLATNNIRRIQFEYGGCNIDSRVMLKDLFALLGSHGYSLFKVFPREILHVEHYDQRLENYNYQNWVAMPKRAKD